MAFKFKMQKVLEYREQLEEEAKVRFASAQANLQKCREQLIQLVAQLNEAETKGASEVMQSAERWLHDQYLKGLRADHKAMSLQERMLAQMMEEARQHLAACAIDRKTMEKLKERQKIQYLRAEQKQELNFNDEIATIRHKASPVEADSVPAGSGVS